MPKLSRSHHFVRYCKAYQCQEGKILVSAFKLRQKRDEKELSGDYFEYFTENHYQKIIGALQLRHFCPEKGGFLAKLNCGEVIDSLKDYVENKIFFENEKTSSHTLLYGLYNADINVLNILPELVKEVVPVCN